MQKYSKFLVAALGAVAQVVAVQFGSNQYVQIVLAVLAALGVYTVKNKAA